MKTLKYLKRENKNNNYFHPSHNRRVKAKYFSLLFIPLLFALLMAGCNQENQTETEKIREKISEYNEQIVELNQKVSDLERELEKRGERTQNRQQTPVTSIPLELQPFDHYVKVNGSVEAVEEAIISPESNGQVTEILVDKGQRVTQGQVLAKLNTSVIENNIQEVETSLQLAETVYSRQKRLWEQEIGSEVQYLEAKNNYESLQSRLNSLKAQLDMATMTAPFSGIVDEIFIKEGEMAMPGAMVMQLINMQNIYINADVSENFLPHIKKDEEVILRFSAYPDFERKVPVHRVGNVINPENRTFRLQLKLDNPDERFKPNMVATLGIQSFTTNEALVVPSILIKQDVQGHFVYTIIENEQGDLVADKVYVERGPSSEGLTMIQSGLEQGDKLINAGHNRVNDGTLVKIAEDNILATKK